MRMCDSNTLDQLVFSVNTCSSFVLIYATIYSTKALRIDTTPLSSLCHGFNIRPTVATVANREIETPVTQMQQIVFGTLIEQSQYTNNYYCYNTKKITRAETILQILKYLLRILVLR